MSHDTPPFYRSAPDKPPFYRLWKTAEGWQVYESITPWAEIDERHYKEKRLFKLYWLAWAEALKRNKQDGYAN